MSSTVYSYLFDVATSVNTSKRGFSPIVPNIGKSAEKMFQDSPILTDGVTSAKTSGILTSNTLFFPTAQAVTIELSETPMTCGALTLSNIQGIVAYLLSKKVPKQAKDLIRFFIEVTARLNYVRLYIIVTDTRVKSYLEKTFNFVTIDTFENLHSEYVNYLLKLDIDPTEYDEEDDFDDEDCDSEW